MIVLFVTHSTVNYQKEAAYWAGMLLLTYLGIAVIGYLLPLVDLLNTTKRAMFKVVPIALMHVAYSGCVRQLSAKLYRISGPEARTWQATVSPDSQVKRKKRKK